MKIAHIANMYGPKSGGLKTSVNELTREYIEKGHEVLVIVPSHSDSYERLGNKIFITVKSPVIPFSGGYRVIFRIKRVIQHLEDYLPDVIEISDRTTLLRVTGWAKARSIPTSLFAHERVDGIMDTFMGWIPFKVAIVDFWNRFTLRRVNKIIATTDYAATEFKKLFHDSENYQSRLALVPLGVDLDQFNPDYVGGKTQLIDNIRNPYILACTRLSKEKDPLFLLDIARVFREKGIRIPLVIAGSGPMEKKMVRKIKREKLNVHLVGFVSEKSELAILMAQAHLFLAVGPIETFGLAALESLASGTPVICRDVAAISEIVDVHSGSALPRDAQAWVRAITYFLAEDREILRVHSRARAEVFSWSRCAQSMLELHAELVTQ